jgi:transcriptional regulator with XRE-family HTH domain
MASGTLVKVSYASNEVVPGPLARQVVANVKTLRTERGWTRERLSEELTKVGRPIRATGLARLEAGRRRVDADDLGGIALAFGVSPVRLLLPPEDTGDKVGLTETRSTNWQAAWRWAVGDEPLTDDRVELTDPRVAEFIRENRPFEGQAPARELARWLRPRIPGPFRAYVEADVEGRAKARVTLGTGDSDDAAEEDTGGQHREAT